MGSGGGCKFTSCWRKLFRIKSQRVSGDCSEVQPGVTYHKYYDLTTLGVASTLSSSVYIFAGQTVKDVAGPSAILSVVIAAIAGALSFICYAELRCRSPRFQGTAYDYTYFSAGEAAAFLVAWFSLLKHVACISAVGRAICVNIDAVTNFRLYNLTLDNVGVIDGLDSVPVFLAGFVILVLTTVASLGITVPRHGHMITCVFTAILLLFVMVVGLFHVDFNEWKDFFKDHMSGVLNGAATMFYAFTFFEVITNKSDFISRGGKVTILSTALTAFVVLTLTLGVSGILSLLPLSRPLRTDATFAEIFDDTGVGWARYIIAVGAILALVVTLWQLLLSGASELQRVSKDGLVFECIHWTMTERDTSTIPAFVIGILAVIFSIIFPMTNLVQLTSHASLVVYIVSCTSVTSLRYNTPKSFAMANLKNRRKRRRRKKFIYNPDGSLSYGSTVGSTSHPANTPTPRDVCLIDVSNGTANGTLPLSSDSQDQDSSDTDIDDIVEEYREKLRVKSLTSCGLHSDRLDIPNEATHKRASWALTAFVLFMLCESAILVHGNDQIRAGSVSCIVLVTIFILLSFLAAWMLTRQPLDIEDLSDVAITIPVLPWIPLISLVVNTHLVMRFGGLVWLQAFVWFILGAAIYFGYGLRHSKGGHMYSILPNEHHGLLPDTPTDGLNNLRDQPAVLSDGDAPLLQ